jgi:hypothetical protein
MLTSENMAQAKFTEHPFHALGCIKHGNRAEEPSVRAPRLPLRWIARTEP